MILYHFCTYILSAIFWGLVNGDERNKRILMSDPDVAQRFHNLEVTVQKLVGEVSGLRQQKNDWQNHKGAIYTRWGRKDCPANTTELLYTGTVGGGWYDRSGVPAEYICLPHDPDFISGETARFTNTDYVSSLYGAEYEDLYFGKQLVDNDVPCAVCRATHHTSVLMIPGKTNCYNNWNREYYGRLAAGANIHKAASQYICVDHNAQALEAGGTDQNGKLLYPVRAVCGTLRCPPYHNNAFISCVVCSN